MQGLAAIAVARDAPFRFADVTLDPPRPDEVQVRIVSAGICHTDLSAKDELLGIPLPMVLGHEGAGVVEAVGSSVRHVRAGDHVVLSGASCGICRNCHSGLPSYCDEFVARNMTGLRVDGTTPMCLDGEPLPGLFCGQSSFATRVVVQARTAVKIDPAMPLDIAGPIGCALVTGVGTVQNALKPRPGSCIAIFGVGAVGLSAVLGARLCGAERIIAIDPQAARLDIARSLGATDCLAPDADLVARVRELTRGGADYVVECSGNPAAIEQAIAVLATPGWSAQVGAPPVGTHVRLDVGAVGFGRGVRGVVLGEANPQTYVPYLVALHLRGELPFDRFVTAYAFADIDRAVADAQTGAVVKPVLRMPGV